MSDLTVVFLVISLFLAGVLVYLLVIHDAEARRHEVAVARAQQAEQINHASAMRFAEMNHTIQEQEQTILTMRGRLLIVEATAEERRRELAGKQQRLETLATDHDTLNRDSASAIRELKEWNRQLQDNLNASTERYNIVFRNYNALVEERNTLARRVVDYQESDKIERARLTAAIEERDQLAAQLADLKFWLARIQLAAREPSADERMLEQFRASEVSPSLLTALDETGLPIVFDEDHGTVHE